jgi:hypothetical protein
VAIISKDQRRCLVSGLLGIVLMLIIILSYRIYAQTLDSIVNQRNGFGVNIPYIKVGHVPSDIAVNPDTNKVS